MCSEKEKKELKRPEKKISQLEAQKYQKCKKNQAVVLWLPLSDSGARWATRNMHGWST